MPSHFLRCFYALMMFLTSTMGLCSIEHRSIFKILTSNLFARINGGEISKKDLARTPKGETVYSNGERWFIFNAGEQPDLETCAAESWAMHRVNPQTGFAQENDEVTQWYCDMFLPNVNRQGLERIQDLATNAGLGTETIIQYDASITEDPGVKGQFEQAFRKIARNPVGRMLLYRLLIEIYRNDGKGFGCCEYEEKIPQNLKNLCNWSDLLDLRNNSRSLDIHRDLQFSYNFPATINFSAQTQYVTVLKTKSQKLNGYVIGLNKCEIDIALFHELLHWFHFLYRPYATSLDLNPKTSVCLDEKGSIGSHYYLNIKDYRYCRYFINNSSKPWESGFKSSPFVFVAHEEILTVCGGSADWPPYRPGLELSENLYRASQSCPLRIGHGSCAYIEDKLVTERIVSSTQNNLHKLGSFFGNISLTDNNRLFDRCFYSRALLEDDVGRQVCFNDLINHGIGGMMYID